MAIHTQYICDRCGHTQKDDYQMWDVGWGFCSTSGSLFRSDKYQACPPVIRGLWCRKCLEKFHFLPSGTPPVQKCEPTLEDMLREMIREEISDAKGTC